MKELLGVVLLLGVLALLARVTSSTARRVPAPAVADPVPAPAGRPVEPSSAHSGPWPTVPPSRYGAAVTAAVEVSGMVTVPVGTWLERSAGHRLDRAPSGTVTVHEHGVRLVDRSGAATDFIAWYALRGVERASGVPGELVGRDGVVVLRWATHGADRDGPEIVVETGVHPRYAADREVLLDAVQALLDGTSRRGGAA